MKILHTSDWHLGQMLYSYERTEEYLFFFRQIKEILRWEMPDVMIVSGDIFDVSNPPVSISKMFKDTILEFRSIVPDMEIIITAGNHDSASRIDVDRNLWRSIGVHVIGALDRKDGGYDFSDIIIEIPKKGIIAAVPFVNRASLLNKRSAKGGEYDLFKMLEEEVEVLNKDNLPVVVMAHLPVADCDTEGHKDKPIGGFDSVNAEIFGNGFDYVALGHIHKPQIMGEGRLAYSGAPIAVSFDEAYPHSVAIVNVERGEKPYIEMLEIKQLRPLKTIPEEGVPFKKALKALEKLDDNDMSYIRLNVRQETGLPVDCMEEAVKKTRGKKCRFCTIKNNIVTAAPSENLLKGLNAFEFKEMSPGEVAESYLTSTGLEPDVVKEYLELLAQLENEIVSENGK